MPTKRSLLPLEFGKLSRLTPERNKEIRAAAAAAAQAIKSDDKKSWENIITVANKNLSKHERGMFAGFLIVEAGQ